MKKIAEGVDQVKHKRILPLILMDMLLVNIAVFASYLVRFEFRIAPIVESGFIEGYLTIAPVYTLLAVGIFWSFRLYRSLWEYASINELHYIILASLFAGVAELCICLLCRVPQPRSLPFLNVMALMLMLTGFRYSYRIGRRLHNRPREEQARTMLIGAGASGAMVLQELQRSSHSRNKVVCMIDDDHRKIGSYLNSVQVVGDRTAIPEMVRKYSVEEIIIAMPNVDKSQRRQIINICQQTRCRLRTLPGIYQLASGQIDIKRIRDVRVEDLLGREKVVVNLDEIGGYLRSKVVMVTGGGGSIGSELCRQIAHQRPKQLIIFDIYENNAYSIQQELRYNYPELDLVVLIGSVRDRARVESIFAQYHPQMVYHAAAHKHVPLMEDSPNESIKNNVFGTLNVAQCADRYGVERFVLISTDKAVNPTNIMGASKRICEMIVQVLSQTSRTRFTAVRFGNVLGSNGSVIPLFKKQIAHGGPVTVTHKDIIRYFMTISEAVSLVLQAGYYAQGGEVFVLDMGEPMRIDDLARNMIRLSGFEPDVDIKVEYTGLRPGEKLFEELLMQDEGLDKTPNDLIYIGHFNDFDSEKLLEHLEELWSACQSNSDDIRDRVQSLVKTYHPQANKPAARQEEAPAVRTECQPAEPVAEPRPALAV